MTDYIVLLMGDTEAWWDTPEEEKKATYDVHGRFTEELERRGHTIVGGAELPRASEAKSLAPHSDTVTDGYTNTNPDSDANADTSSPECQHQQPKDQLDVQRGYQRDRYRKCV